MIKIKTFKVIFNKKKNFLFYFEDLKNNWHFNKIKKNYFLGYFYEEYQKTSGEYLKICIDNNYLEIINDKFGTYNVFIYNNPTHTIISNSLSNILEDRDKKQNIDINIQSENIYEYFSKNNYRNISVDFRNETIDNFIFKNLFFKLK